MCTLEQRSNVFILTLTGNGEHRLNPTLIASILSALRRVRSQASCGSVLITTSQGKFFSNGLDLSWAMEAGSVSTQLQRLHHMVESLRQIIAELISLPIPTVAAVQGHAAGAGFVLALSHDYFLMRSDKGLLYMSEVDMGGNLPDYFTALFQGKVGSGVVRRDVLLRGKKVKGMEAMEMGIVDGVGGSEESLAEAAVKLAEQLGSRKWHCQAYQQIRKGLYPHLCSVIEAVGNLPAKL